jgi:hypothetical protein
MALSLESKSGWRPSAPYLPYTQPLNSAPNEAVIFDELSRTIEHITRTMASRYRHAYPPVHAKSHGILVRTLDVPAGLAEPLVQGLFAKAGSHPVIMRFSTNPGDLLLDKVSSPRGLAVKVLGSRVRRWRIMPGIRRRTSFAWMEQPSSHPIRRNS